MTLQLVAATFGQGASVVFGHDWREDGVMEAVYGFARQVQPPVPLSSDSATAEAQPILRNLLPWPDNPHLPERDLEQLKPHAARGVRGAAGGTRRLRFGGSC